MLNKILNKISVNLSNEIKSVTMLISPRIEDIIILSIGTFLLSNVEVAEIIRKS